jgi:hypothetical protein
MNMTWKQFKDSVERQMEKQDVSEDTEIWYIDISSPDLDEVDVGVDPAVGMAIT